MKPLCRTGWFRPRPSVSRRFRWRDLAESTASRRPQRTAPARHPPGWSGASRRGLAIDPWPRCRRPLPVPAWGSPPGKPAGRRRNSLWGCRCPAARPRLRRCPGLAFLRQRPGWKWTPALPLRHPPPRPGRQPPECSLHPCGPLRGSQR